jgi:hypothetical protein
VTRGWNGVMPDVWVLILDDIVDQVRFHTTIVKFFGWMTGTSLTHLTLSVVLSCTVILLNGIRVNAFTIVTVVNTQLGLSKKT